MEEESKRISYSQFKECVCKDIKMYFSDAELRKKNYEVSLREDTDAYEAKEELLFLMDLRNPQKSVPEYSLPTVYETYCRSGDVNGVVAALAVTMEKQYPKEKKPQEIKGEPVRSIVIEVEGYPEEDIRTVYLITDQNEERSAKELLKEDDTLAAIADKEKNNLQIIVVDDKAILAIPASSESEVEVNLEIITELQKMLQREPEAGYQLYDRDKNMLLSDMEEIKDLLAKKQKKKSMFTK